MMNNNTQNPVGMDYTVTIRTALLGALAGWLAHTSLGTDVNLTTLIGGAVGGLYDVLAYWVKSKVLVPNSNLAAKITGTSVLAAAMLMPVLGFADGTSVSQPLVRQATTVNSTPSQKLTIAPGTNFAGEFVYSPTNKLTSAVVGTPFMTYGLKYGFSIRASALIGVNSAADGTAGFSGGINWNWNAGANTKQALSFEAGFADLYSTQRKPAAGIYFGFSIQG
jgi:hypothetical protein